MTCQNSCSIHQHDIWNEVMNIDETKNEMQLKSQIAAFIPFM